MNVTISQNVEQDVNIYIFVVTGLDMVEVFGVMSDWERGLFDSISHEATVEATLECLMILVACKRRLQK